MDREKLFRYLDRRYCSKREMLSRIPLGVQPDMLWQELLNLRRSRSTVLPLYSYSGIPYWYVTTEKMVAASEKIIEALMEYEAEDNPAAEPTQASTLEEVFYTSYVEGSQITMQEAMAFLTGDLPPRSIEEQMITNNRMAGSYAGGNLYRSMDPALLQDLAFILTDGMDNGGQEYRSSAQVDFTSTDEESFEFPSPHVLPECVAELCSYLADRTVHPLIKAAVAQAYLYAVRPFPEGNERLGRILSSMILLRAGYGFFGDVSLSALIARKSYAYYEAMANVLRTENGNDMTYFMEFFLELLSRAVDERRLRIRQREEESRQAETELARTALVPPSVLPASTAPQEAETAERTSGAGDDPTPESKGRSDEGPMGGEENLLEGYAPLSELDMMEDEDPIEDDELSLARVRDLLYELSAGDSTIMKNGATALLDIMKLGIRTFTVEDLQEKLGLDQKQIGNLRTHLKEKGVIESTSERSNGHMLYRFGTKIPPLMPRDYTAEVIDRVKELIDSRSPKDKRIGEVLSGCMAKGIVTLADYDGLGDRDKMGSDMLLPLRMGLLTKLDVCVYRVNRTIPEGPPVISKGQKEVLKSLYQKFRGRSFTVEEAALTLAITKSSANAHMHQFVLLRIMECSGSWSFTYRILVNPEEDPTLFSDQEDSSESAAEETPEKTQDLEEAQIPDTRQAASEAEQAPACSTLGYAEEVYDMLNKLETSASNKDRRLAEAVRQCLNKSMLLESDYKKWGYSHNMWLYDTELARQLGLVRRLAPDAYVINKKLRPELQPKQKKTVSAIYETFGDQAFSPEMFIATLNYSSSYSYVALHRLTLLRILDQRSTEDGNQYQLLVNPEDHPECFEAAA